MNTLAKKNVNIGGKMRACRIEKGIMQKDMCAWKSPDVERLWKILQEVEW